MSGAVGFSDASRTLGRAARPHDCAIVGDGNNVAASLAHAAAACWASTCTWRARMAITLPHHRRSARQPTRHGTARGCGSSQKRPTRSQASTRSTPIRGRRWGGKRKRASGAQIFAPYQVNDSLMALAEAGRAVHALPAGASRRGSHRRSLRITGIGGVRSGRKPSALSESAALDAAVPGGPLAIIGAMAAPWLDHYDDGVPTTLSPYPSQTLLDHLADAARDQPDRPALLFKGATMTFARLGSRRAMHLPSALASLGVTRGDRRRAAAAQLSAVFRRAVRRLEARRHRRAAQSDLHRARARRADRQRGHRDNRHADAILSTRRSASSRGRSCGAIIATNIKDYFPPLLRILFTLVS